VLLVVGVVALVAAGIGLYATLAPRPLTAAEKARYTAQAIAAQWHTRTPGQLFPGSVNYQVQQGDTTVGPRVGIAPQATCSAGADTSAAATLQRFGCQTVLRATYVDATGTYAVTVGVAVFPSKSAARSAQAALDTGDQKQPGVTAVPFQNTITSRFGSAQRLIDQAQLAGPYVVMTAAGYTDGRTQASMPTDQSYPSALSGLSQAVAKTVAGEFTASPKVPRCTWGTSC
jgi:hypothetical protein